MSAVLSFVVMTLRTRARRILGLAAFGLIFLAAAATARVTTGGAHGHLELDVLFELGGTTLVSAMLLTGWTIGRFPIIAVLVLMHGAFSEDRDAGYTRLYAVRPRSMVLLHGARFMVLIAIAFIMSMVLMPAFDLLILGEWTGRNVVSLVVAQIMVYGSVMALLTVITRADAWAALFLGIVALIWDALRRMDFFQASAPFVREAVSTILPPQGALTRVEAAFAVNAAVPWDAMVYIAIYAVLVLIIAAVALVRREI